MQFCRSSCIDINNDDFSHLEKNCLKNCTEKYLSLFDTYRKIKHIYENKFGSETFIFDQKSKENITKLINFAELNAQNNDYI
jgi:hypothetical protein